MEYEFSIIIPAWNVEKYIDKCLESVVSQTFDKPYEILVCLGDSSDSTEDKIKRFMDKNKNIRIIKSLNKKTMELRINGIKQSKGKYIAFLDADDYYCPNYLEEMYKEIEKGFDIVNCSFYNEKNNKIRKNHFVKNKCLDKYESCKALLSDSYMRSFYWCKVFKRELFKDNNFILPKTDIQMFEDTISIFDVFLKANNIKSIKKPLYHYVYNPNSITKKENPDRFNFHLASFLVIKLIAERSTDKKIIKIFRKKILRFKFSLLFDAQVSRHITKKSMFGLYYLNRKDVKLLRSKSPTNLNNYGWKQYVLDCLEQ